MLVTHSIPWERRGGEQLWWCLSPEPKMLPEVVGAAWGMGAGTFSRASASSPVRGNIDLRKEAWSILGMGVPS